MKSHYHIEREKLQEGIKKFLLPTEESIRIELTNELMNEITEYMNADPWVLGRTIYLLLRKYGLEDKSSQFALFLINGNSFDEKVILYSIEFHRKKFPPIS